MANDSQDNRPPGVPLRTGPGYTTFHDDSWCTREHNSCAWRYPGRRYRGALTSSPIVVRPTPVICWIVLVSIPPAATAARVTSSRFARAIAGLPPLTEQLR